MSDSEFQDITRHLLAASSAKAADGRTFFLFTDGSSLVSKEWTGKEFINTTIVAESVRPNSATGYVHTPSIEVIVYIDSSSKLRALRFDDDSDEWNEYQDNGIRRDVFTGGNVALCHGLTDDSLVVVFESREGHLTAFNLGDPLQQFEIDVNSLTKSPLCASTINGILHVFYISSDDNCIHYTTWENDAWRDTKWSMYPFEGAAKRLIVTANPNFEAHVLTEEGVLLHIAVEGQWERLGKVDENGNFISERNIDLCCLDAQNNTLTEEGLERYLAADGSIIDAVGGPMSATPLATACWNGSLDAACLLLDNPYRLADPNALSPGNRTPLYYAVSRSPAYRKEMVSALLDAGARVDDCYAEDELNTPLMNAVADTQDKDVIHELVDRGASITKRNMRGQTAVMLADGTGMGPELRPSKERNARPHSIQKELTDVFVAIAMLIIAYFNNDGVRDIVGIVLAKLHEMNGDPEEISGDE